MAASAARAGQNFSWQTRGAGFIWQCRAAQGYGEDIIGLLKNMYDAYQDVANIQCLGIPRVLEQAVASQASLKAKRGDIGGWLFEGASNKEKVTFLEAACTDFKAKAVAVKEMIQAAQDVEDNGLATKASVVRAGRFQKVRTCQ